MRACLRQMSAVACVLSFCVFGCSRENDKDSAASTGAIIDAVPDVVDFARDIQPIIEQNCVFCHADGESEGGLSMASRATLLSHASAIVPGDSDASLLIAKVKGEAEGKRMPPTGPGLTEDEIAILSRWIEQDATWPPDITFGDAPAPTPDDSPLPISLEPPDLAETDGHPIDVLLNTYAREHGATPNAMIDDAAFMRRVSLDLVGLLPSREALMAFVERTDPDKRARLVEALLADRRNYAEHWLTFWNDLLRNDYAGTGYIDGGRTQITTWLYSALFENLPYDEFMVALVAPTEETKGFANGIKWRGEINESQSIELQYAQSVSQVFLGINMKCASCHDSFINEWKLKDAYGLAAIFSERPMELHRCDVPTGEMAEPTFMFDDFGTVDPSAARDERLDAFANILVHPLNGRTPRTIVNRVWTRLMGRGLVTPIDDAAGSGWNPSLLDYLAADLVAHDYDLKHLIRQIVTSDAYRRRSVPDPQVSDASFVFVGPVSTRMTAEQFVDAVWGITNTAPEESHAPIAGRDGNGRWIWAYEDASSSIPAAGEMVEFVTEISVSRDPSVALVVITCDNEYTLSVNDRIIATDADWPTVETHDITSALVTGSNMISVVGKNLGDVENPAGLFVQGVIKYASGFPTEFQSDGTWKCRIIAPEEKAAAWAPAVPVKRQGFLGSRVNQRLRTSWAAAWDDDTRRVRAALRNASPIMRSLGRPNREQIVSSRPRELTMLQALDLTNGPEVQGWMKRGAEQLYPELLADPTEFVETLYMSMLARAPERGERAIALELLGETPSVAGVEDLLWVMSMLPEFQAVK